MTHNDIIRMMRQGQKRPKAESPGTIGDYISLAVLYGWDKAKTVRELFDLYRRTGNEQSWNQLCNLYDRYMTDYSKQFQEGRR